MSALYVLLFMAWSFVAAVLSGRLADAERDDVAPLVISLVLVIVTAAVLLYAGISL